MVFNGCPAAACIDSLLLGLRRPLNAVPGRLPLLVVEGGLVDEPLELGEVVRLTDKEAPEDDGVEEHLPDEAVLLVEEAGAGELVDDEGHEVADHGGTAVHLLGGGEVEPLDPGPPGTTHRQESESDSAWVESTFGLSQRSHHPQIHHCASISSSPL